MNNDEIINGLDNKAIKNQGISAIEALFSKINFLENKLRDYEMIIANAEQNKKYCSDCGWMDAKQVSDYLGYKVHRVYELAYSKTLKTKKEGKSRIFFFDDVLAYKRRIETEAGLKVS